SQGANGGRGAVASGMFGDGNDRRSTRVAVGDREAAVLAEGLRRDAYAGRGLTPLVLGPVDEGDDPADQSRVVAGLGQLAGREVVLDVGLEDWVELLVRRQGLVVTLVGSQLGRRRLGEHRLGDHRLASVALV